MKICEIGRLKKKTMTMDDEGRLSIGEQPVTRGDATNFYNECRVKGRVLVAWPAAIQRQVEVLENEKAISELQRRIESAKVEREADAEEQAKIIAEEEAVLARIAELENELRELSKQASVARRRFGPNPYDTQIAELEAEHDELTAEVEAEREALQRTDRVTETERYSFLAAAAVSSGADNATA